MEGDPYSVANLFAQDPGIKVFVGSKNLLKPSAVFEIKGVFVLCVVGMLGSVGNDVSMIRDETRSPGKRIDRTKVEIYLHEHSSPFWQRTSSRGTGIQWLDKKQFLKISPHCLGPAQVRLQIAGVIPFCGFLVSGGQDNLTK
jgi:hypothetical protein